MMSEFYPSLNAVSAATERLLQLPGDPCSPLFSDLRRIQRATRQLSESLQTCVDKNLSPHVGHDLRTPVNAIIGFSELLLEDLSDRTLASDLTPGLTDVLQAGKELLTKLDALTLANGEQTQKTSQLSSPCTGQSMSHDTFAHTQVLMIDDNANNRKLLGDQLSSFGFDVHQADSGHTALQILANRAVDIILLDMLMPGMSGYDLLITLKADQTLRDIPVLVLSALNENDSIISCIEQGAEDYLLKPSHKTVLKTKINACLERKHLRDQLAQRIEQIERENQQSEKLLFNTLPKPIAARLKNGETSIADSHAEATVLFADLVNFTPLSATVSAADLVQHLEEIFRAFDSLVKQYKLEKIKTIGDAYMLAGGVPEARSDHATAVASVALEMLDALARINLKNGTDFQLRIGIHSGSLIAGVIGKHKFSYDVWGDTVNVASRMESSSLPGHIQVSANTQAHLDHEFTTSLRGVTPVKGKAPMKTYWLHRKATDNETIETNSLVSGIEQKR